MKVVKVRGYICPECGSLQGTKPEEQTAWRVNDNELVDGYLLEEPEKVAIYIYEECEHITEDEPQETELYECGECEERYEDRDEAKACCKD